MTINSELVVPHRFKVHVRIPDSIQHQHTLRDDLFESSVALIKAFKTLGDCDRDHGVFVETQLNAFAYAQLHSSVMSYDAYGLELMFYALHRHETADLRDPRTYADMLKYVNSIYLHAFKNACAYEASRLEHYKDPDLEQGRGSQEKITRLKQLHDLMQSATISIS